MYEKNSEFRILKESTGHINHILYQHFEGTVEKNFIPYLKPELRGYDFAGWTSIVDSTEQTIFEPYTIIPAGIGAVKLIALFEEEF